MKNHTWQGACKTFGNDKGKITKKNAVFCVKYSSEKKKIAI